MSLISEYSGLTRPQKIAIWAGYLGWALDAFDFFLMVFMLKAISESFGTDITHVSEALFLTLAARPVGALVFGWLGDRFGRRPILILVILMFAGFSALSGMARSLPELLLIRGLFGFAMGGEWGLGASLVMETIPARLRGPVSGLLQSGYASGYLLASLALYLAFDRLGWRYMFLLGVVPALLVVLIRMGVEESPVFLKRQQAPRVPMLTTLVANWKLALYPIVLMTAMNFLSHGTGDLYPTFLQKQHGFDAHATGMLTAIMNVGSIIGAQILGHLSERFGRRRMITLCCLLVLPVVPLWSYSQGTALLGAGAFFIGFCVQGAWSIVPAHLNELSPPAIRAMFPGLVYQLGNLIASRVTPFQAGIAEHSGGNYAYALALVTSVSALVLAAWINLGPERREELE